VALEPSVIEAGVTEKLTVGAGTVTVTAAVPDLEESWVEVAVIVAVPEAAGVKTPLALIVPMVEGVTDQVTAVLKLPVPDTVDEHVEVWLSRIDAGEQLTDTEVMVTGVPTVTMAEPDLVASWADVAVIVAVPAADGVNTPELLMAPMLAGLTDQVTVEL
jgi:hypothetical protein